MRTFAEVRLVQLLHALGLNHCEISRATRIPRSTLRNWLADRLPCSADPRTHEAYASPWERPRRDVWEQYSYLLGLYLGDGYIAAHRRGVYRLEIALDARYPEIVDACAAAMEAVLPENRAAKRRHPQWRMYRVVIFSKQMPTLFPQHGPGRKHTREIRLEPWQQEIVSAFPHELLCGLIDSDGCRGLNHVNGKGYPRYMFSNRSLDIQRIFCDACDRVGIHWTQSYKWTISVARGPDVRRLDDFIGPKR